MKLKLALALTLSTLGVGSAFADTIDFTGSNASLGHSHVYNPGPNSVTAYAFGGSALLYGKHGGGSENGVGIAGNSDNEISNLTFIQLDLANISGLFSLAIGSTQRVEGFLVCSSNTLGSLGACVDFMVPGTDPFSTPNSMKSNRFVSIQADRAGSDVLLNGLTTTPSPVPEPGSFFLLGTGIAAAVGMVRRKLSV